VCRVEGVHGLRLQGPTLKPHQELIRGVCVHIVTDKGERVCASKSEEPLPTLNL
jgi:hypothetical protein